MNLLVCVCGGVCWGLNLGLLVQQEFWSISPPSFSPTFSSSRDRCNHLSTLWYISRCSFANSLSFNKWRWSGHYSLQSEAFATCQIPTPPLPSTRLPSLQSRKKLTPLRASCDHYSHFSPPGASPPHPTPRTSHPCPMTTITLKT